MIPLAPPLRRLVAGAICVGLAAALGGCGRHHAGEAGAARDATHSWQMPLGYAATDFQTVTARLFADAVEQASRQERRRGAGAEPGPRISIQTHPDSSLVAANRIKDAVAGGEMQLGDRLLSAHAGETPLFGYDSVPLLTRTTRDAQRLWQAARPLIAAELNAQNLHLLYSVPFPMQGIYTSRPIRSKADFAGLRLRVYNASGARLAEHLGMVPVLVENSELVAALEAGRVDAVLTSPSTGVKRELWRFFDHFQQLAAWQPRNYVFINLDLWRSLARADRRMLGHLAVAAESFGAHASEQASAAAEKELAANGIRLVRPSAQLGRELEEVSERMTAEWLAGAGERGRQLIAAYRGAS